MATYIVTTEDATPVSCGGVPTVTATRHTLASASRAYRMVAYDAIKAQAGLDTVWGNLAWDRAEDFDRANMSRVGDFVYTVCKQYKVTLRRTA